ncbi:DUF4097 family beta strand repeat-containing protein [Amycolatopsis keratiniphila]|uniref:DUF4097 family beta strand repeat-containing protein n=1 Tax=Amycolatopsis keratiniphila TaxID=129921 RepID=UPI00087BB0AD|nr:DUF4097 family beta strand repeat-containing protein [Amycolatopsis keratiniphila]OLZ45081.1 hypothetical protein BS330_39640 [Amycolatopsis keratiniphila subsp. nogabecina]SDU37666.1 Putative adhesin [Amycolatopsis keratiniphila]
MTEESTPAGEETVRAEDFEAEGPIEVDVSVAIGRVTIELTDENGVHAEVRRDGGEQQPWVDGMTSLLSWVGERFGDQLGGSPVGSAGSVGDAVAQTRIEKVGNRLVVQAPKAWQLKNVPLAVTVRAPAGSHLEVRAGAADVTVTGIAGRADILTGAGKVGLERTDGSAIVRTGTGDVKLGATLSGLQLRTGSGSVEASSLCGSATIATGTGDVWLGEIAGDVLARTGSGDVSVTDAAFGSLELTTGSGAVRVAIRGRVRAEIDLSSTTGSVSSELDVADSAPTEGEVVLKVRARTGTGDAVVTSAAG